MGSKAEQEDHCGRGANGGLEERAVSGLNRATQRLESLSPRQERQICFGMLGALVGIPFLGAAWWYLEQNRLAYLKDFAIIPEELTQLRRGKIEFIMGREKKGVYFLNLSNNWDINYDRRVIEGLLGLAEVPENAFVFYDKRIYREEQDGYLSEFFSLARQQCVNLTPGIKMVVVVFSVNGHLTDQLKKDELTRYSPLEKEALGILVGAHFSAQVAVNLRFGKTLEELDKDPSLRNNPNFMGKIRESDAFGDELFNKILNGQERPMFQFVYAGKK